MRLKQICVLGLFGRFNHRIELKFEDRITIITSPNGFGKTMILRIVNALFNQSFLKLTSIPFSTLELTFDDGSRISVERLALNENSHPRTRLRVTYKTSFGELHPFEPTGALLREELRVPIDSIEDVIAELNQLGPERWQHLETGETLSLEDVLERYADELTQATDNPQSGLPDWLRRIRAAVPVRFIDTDRLYTSAGETRHRRVSTVTPNRFMFRALATHSEPSVERYSRELGETIKGLLARYGTLSQSLDRTFPARVVA